MIVRRNLSPSKLRNLFNPSFLSTYTYKNSISNHYSPWVYAPSPSPPLPHFPQNPTKTLFPSFFLRPFSSEAPKVQSFQLKTITRDGNSDESSSSSSQESLIICPGCGVPMQDFDSKQPGYYMVPNPRKPRKKSEFDKNPVFDESEISDFLKRGFLDEPIVVQNDENIEIEEEKLAPGKPTVCARCHSLRHYGKVKDPSVENLLPDFDFDHTVGRRLMSVTGPRTVVMMVVDASDFDGSFPKKVANLVSKTIDEHSRAWKEGKSANVPRIVLVVTKIDLLPSSLSPTRLEHWVRTRAREGGAIKLTSVHLVSAFRHWGVKNLVNDVVRLAGARGHVWAIGSQNAGKSTLINAIGKYAGGEVTHLTEAPVPGTTLGILRVEGVLPGNAKLFDTPGLLHPHQISTRLNREEQRLVHISKELKPRTYRIKAGQSVHLGGLVRLDVEKLSVDSLYVTVWASHLLPLHMGKTENACTMIEEHLGRQLQPPIGKERVEELGKWVKKEFHVSGNSWDSSSLDISASGLGWFSIGLKGDAELSIWTYDGVEIIVRNALLPHKSRNFEESGFSVSKIVSKADQTSNKQRRDQKKRKSSNSNANDSDSTLSEAADSLPVVAADA